MLSKEEIEKFIQEMTEVRPDELNKEALRLYNTIMQILDKNEQLETVKNIKEALELANVDIKTLVHFKYENKRLKANNQKLIEKLEETRDNLERDGYIGYADEIQEILEIAKGEK